MPRVRFERRGQALLETNLGDRIDYLRNAYLIDQDFQVLIFVLSHNCFAHGALNSLCFLNCFGHPNCVGDSFCEIPPTAPHHLISSALFRWPFVN
jgi:hypothetical protein